jgi:hypothetical protein
MRLPLGWVIYNERRARRERDAETARTVEALIPFELAAMASIDREHEEEVERWEKARRWDELQARLSRQDAGETASTSCLA